MRKGNVLKWTVVLLIALTLTFSNVLLADTNDIETLQSSSPNTILLILEKALKKYYKNIIRQGRSVRSRPE